MGAQTETELKEKKLRVEDALNATKVCVCAFALACLFITVPLFLMCAVFIGHGEQAAVEEGIVVGGGCALLRLSSKVDAIKDTLENYEQKVCLHLLENRFFCLAKH